MWKRFCFVIPYAFVRCNLVLLTATFPPLTLSSRIGKMLDEAQFSCHYLWPLNSRQLLFFSIFNVLRLWLRIEWTEWWNVPDSCHRLPPLPPSSPSTNHQRLKGNGPHFRQYQRSCIFFKHTTHWLIIRVSKTSVHRTAVRIASFFL